MSEAKITPGPWVVFHDHPDPECAKSLACIAPITRTEYDAGNEVACVYVAGPGTEGEANANLLAASWDLLEAARQAVQFVAFAKEQGLPASNVYELLDSAIRKATGEQQ